MTGASDDHYQLLGVSRSADAREIKRAYFARIRLFPPETHPEEFRRLRTAYEVLSNPQSRSEYDAELANSYEELGQELSAFMRSANAAMGGKDWTAAASLLEAVLAQRPELEEARGRLTACFLELSRFDRAEAEARELVRRYPSQTRGWLFLGLAQAGQGRKADATDSYREAVRSAPADPGPLRALLENLAQLGLPFALEYVEERLSQPNARPIDLVLRFHRVMLLNLLGRWPEADGEVAHLVSIAPDQDIREEVRYFFERQAAQLFSRGEVRRGQALLERASALNPEASTSAGLATQVRVRFDELPVASREWLLAQRANPSIFFVPGPGLGTDLALAAAAFACAALATWGALSGFTDPHSPRSFAVMVCSVVGSLYAACVWTVRRARRTRKSALGRFKAVHPLYLLEVDLDEINALPLVAVAKIYLSEASVALDLGAHRNGVAIAMPNIPEAERLAYALSGIRARLLELLGAGMLAAEPSADFIPRPLLERGAPPVQWRGGLRGYLAAVGAAVAVSLLGMLLAERSAESNAWEVVRRSASAIRVRQYLAAHPEGRFTGAAQEHAAQLQAKAIEASSACPALAQALSRTHPPKVTEVMVRLTGQVERPGFDLPRGFSGSLVELPPDVIAPAATAERERRLLQMLQQSIDGRIGAGWVTLVRGEPAAAEPVIDVSYTLSLSGRGYSVQTGGAFDAQGTVWFEPVIRVKASFGSNFFDEAVLPPSSMSLPSEVWNAVLRPGSAAEAYPAIIDATYSALAARLALALGTGP
ncbi:MAG: DnaJ domain-containing protein [Myxococcaceae bacterium]